MLNVGRFDAVLECVIRNGRCRWRGKARTDFFCHRRISRKIQEAPDDDRESENHCARAKNEFASTFPHAMKNIAQSRHTIVRHLQNEGLGFDFEEKCIEKPSQREGEGQANEVHRKERPPSRKCSVTGLNECADKKDVNGQTRRATHKRCHENGREAGLGIREGAGGHHSRNSAGVAG